MRDFWRSVEGRLPDVAERISGSADLFADDGRLPYASVNFVTAHDGFTLADLVSYDEKHNDANGEGNRDGTNDNRSWNCGAEGPTDDEGVRALRARQQRNFIASLVLSQGTPMLLGGDEIGRTQQGNNNACQDNAIAWYDWELDDERRELLAFARRAFTLRREHPVLRQRHWPTGITWLTPDGREMQGADWQAQYARAAGMLVDGEQIRGRANDGSRVRDASLLVLLNAWWERLEFALPEGRWSLLLDTADANAAAGSRAYATGDRVTVAGRAIVVLER
jgi:glycogen operon protein